MKIFVSTSGTRGSSVAQALKLLDAGFSNIELSGGNAITDIEKQMANLAQKADSLMLHNYFPPPSIPFVFNLASNNEEIRNQSLNLATSSIKLSSSLKISHYAVHAGFLVDPKVSELGRRISKSNLLERSVGMSIFIESVKSLANVAKECNVNLLVENNVLSEDNMKSFGENPLLLVDEKEIISFFESIGSDVGLLLDVGHLSVSSKTLGQSREDSMKNLAHLVSGYHLHDNNRLSDEHKEIAPNSWFLGLLSSKARFATLEIHSQNIDEIRTSVSNVEMSMSL